MAILMPFIELLSYATRIRAGCRPLSADGVMPKAAPDDTDVIVGRNIRALRLARGMTQRVLGAKIGVTYQQLQKNERGVNRVDAARLERIAAALGVPATALLDGVPGSRAGEASAQHHIREKYAERLLLAFALIKDDSLRRSIVRFVENVAGAQP